MRSLLCHLSIFVSGCDRVDLCWNVFSVWFRLMYDKQHHKPTSANSTMHQDSPGSETGKPNTFGTQISMWLCNLITDFGCIIYKAAFYCPVLYEYSEYDNVIFPFSSQNWFSVLWIRIWFSSHSDQESRSQYTLPIYQQVMN